MKKITLSAVLSALFMMGCSDMGVNNSVASTTREITDVQNQYSADFVPVLKKQTTTFICDRFTSSFFDTSERIGGKRYSIGIASTVSENGGHGKVWIGSPDINSSLKVDMLHVYTVCVRDCDDEGNCKDNSGVVRYDDSYTFLPMPKDGQELHWFDQQCQLKKGDGELGTISYYAAVVNAGKPDEIVLTGSTYSVGSGFKNMNQALLVYQKYLAAPLQNH